MELDLSFAQAARVLPKEFNKLKVFLIGAGGTGSFAALNLARVLFEVNRAGKMTELTIIDPDVVESGNIPRSNFCAAELGRFKAESLAERIALAWGLEVRHVNEKLDYEKHIKPVRNGLKELTILVGCVDNHLGRREIHRALEESNKYVPGEGAPEAWWIDGGNGRASGQVLIGSEVRSKKAADFFTTATICRKLPAPSLIHPDLLEKPSVPALQAHELTTRQRISCAERIRLGEQSLNINQRVALEIGEMLAEMLIGNSLRRFAAYFDLESGTSRSSYCTPDRISAAVMTSVADRQKKRSS